MSEEASAEQAGAHGFQPAAADAFGIKPGDALYVAPQDRVQIW